MWRICILAGVLSLLCAPAAQATIMVFASSSEVQEETDAIMPIFIQTTAGETLNYAELYLEVIGPDGLPPVFTGVDLNGPGTIFGAAPSTVFPTGAPYDPPTRTLFSSVLVDNPNVNVSANGILAWITFHTHATGAFQLSLSVDSQFGTRFFNNDMGDFYPPEQVQFFAGYMVVGPEPSSLAMAILWPLGLVGAIAAARRRKR